MDDPVEVDVGRVAIPAPERFWPKVEKTESCWLWTAALDRHGYGAFRTSTRSADGMDRAHRFAYELVHGPIPEGMELDHLCRVRRCVNPAHLEPVTSKVNTLRGESPIAVNARRTECINGHEFTESNTRWLTTGKRRCRACHSRQSSSANRARHRSSGTSSHGDAMPEWWQHAYTEAVMLLGACMAVGCVGGLVVTGTRIWLESFRVRSVCP